VGEVGAEELLRFRVDGEIVVDEGFLLRECYDGQDSLGRFAGLRGVLVMTLNRIDQGVVECYNNHFSPLILRFFGQVELSKLLSPGFLVQYVLYTTI